MRQARRLVGQEGLDAVTARVRRRAASWIAPTAAAPLPVRTEHLMRAAEIAAAGWELPGAPAAAPGQPLTVGWVCTPPSAGSGGHTTMFRMVAALEAHGHT